MIYVRFTLYFLGVEAEDIYAAIVYFNDPPVNNAPPECINNEADVEY